MLLVLVRPRPDVGLFRLWISSLCCYQQVYDIFNTSCLAMIL